MAKTKSFRGGKNIADFEPVSFELNDKTFTCRGALQGAAVIEFIRSVDSENGGESVGAMWDLFSEAMNPDEHERFLEYVHNKDVIIGMELLGEIAAWLVEQYTDRPTTGPESSDTGLSSSGPTSTELPSSAV